jgi:hypothetical protein
MFRKGIRKGGARVISRSFRGKKSAATGPAATTGLLFRLDPLFSDSVAPYAASFCALRWRSNVVGRTAVTNARGRDLWTGCHKGEVPK